MAATISANSAGGGGLVTSGDASGVLALQTAGVTALSIDASQKVTFANSLTGVSFAVTPTTVAPQSMVRLNTANGYGSTNTKIRRFTTTVTNQGSDITYADSATLGASFTINTNGVYAISYTDIFTATQDVGISLDSTQLTTGIGSCTVSTILSMVWASVANGNVQASNTLYLPSGSIVRPHTSGGTASGVYQIFTIARVA